MNTSEKAALQFDETWKRDQLDKKNNAFREFQARVADDKATTAAAMRILQPQAAVAVAVEEPVEEVEEIDPNSVELTGNFSEVVAAYHAQKYSDQSSISGHWRRRLRAKIGLGPEVQLDELSFSVSITSYDKDGKELQTIDDSLVEPDFSIEAGTRITRGALGEIGISEKSTVVYYGYFYFGESDTLDLVSARVATDEEVAEFFKPPVVETPAPPAPRVFQKIARVPGDTASFIGFTLGAATQELKTPLLHGWHAFYLPNASVISRVEVPVEWTFPTDHFSIAVCDPSGKCLLQTVLRPSQQGVVKAEFDSVRLEPGDYLLVWSTFGGRTVHGSQNGPNVGLFRGAVPKQPRLDEIVANPDIVFDDLKNCVIPAVLPSFRFQ